MSTIEELQKLSEREDHVEFKKAEHNYPFAGGQKTDHRDRRHCVLGYVVALTNERGGRLVLGMADARPHEVVGSDFAENETGNLEDEIYERLHIRVRTEELYDEKQRRVLVINVPSRPVGKALRFEGSHNDFAEKSIILSYQRIPDKRCNCGCREKFFLHPLGYL